MTYQDFVIQIAQIDVNAIAREFKSAQALEELKRQAREILLDDARIIKVGGDQAEIIQEGQSIFGSK